MKEIRIVNNVKFEIMKPISTGRRSPRYTLKECYARPSEIKLEIFEDWKRYVYNSFEHVWNFGIESYNGFMFTLGWNTPDGQYYVTKTRQEFYPYK